MAEEILKYKGQPRPTPEHRLRHIDGDNLNNQTANLEWYIPDVINFTIGKVK